MVSVPEGGFRRIMHCDLDCFYAAVEMLDDPSLEDKPVIVGGDPDHRGVVSTANYVARRYGVHSAMSAAVARRLCPDAVFLRPRFDRYRELSRRVMTILDEYFLVREQMSIDEAYGALPPGLPGCVPAEAIAREIKSRVRSDTGLIISIGVGRTKSIAKMASDVSKPDGCLVVKPVAEREFLRPLPVGQLNGVGPRTRERLGQLGIATIGDLADYDPAALARLFGKHGRWLWELANGVDERPVVGDHGAAKSISRENTYEHDVASLDLALQYVRELAADVAAAAERSHMPGRTITLKVRWSNFRIITRRRTLPDPTCSAEIIAEVARDLLTTEIAPALAEGAAARLLGIGLSGFATEEEAAAPEGLVQLALFPS